MPALRGHPCQSRDGSRTALAVSKRIAALAALDQWGQINGVRINGVRDQWGQSHLILERARKDSSALEPGSIYSDPIDTIDILCPSGPGHGSMNQGRNGPESQRKPRAVDFRLFGYPFYPACLLGGFLLLFFHAAGLVYFFVIFVIIDFWPRETLWLRGQVLGSVSRNYLKRHQQHSEINSNDFVLIQWGILVFGVPSPGT